MHTAARKLIGLALAAVVAGCAGSGSDGGGGGGGGGGVCKTPPTPTVSLSSNIQPIFNRSCAVAAACHAGPASFGGSDLSVGQVIPNWVRVDAVEDPSLFRIRPGDPDKSFLVIKIGAGPPGTTFPGFLMPQGCPGTGDNGAVCLSADDIEAIRTWIQECAPNN
jgi:hypothetical protein